MRHGWNFNALIVPLAKGYAKNQAPELKNMNFQFVEIQTPTSASFKQHL